MQLDWWTLALEAANFLILVWLLHRFLFRPVMRIVDRRRQETDTARQEAEQARRRADSEAAKLRAERDGVEDERREVLREARARAEAEHDRLIEEARQEAARMLETGRDTLAAERRAALEDLRDTMADVATAMAEGLLARAAAAPVAEAFLQTLLDRLEAMAADERARLTGDPDPEAAVQVATAPALDAEARESWRRRLAGLFADGRDITFAEDPAMIAGARIGLPTASLEISWRQTLDEAREEMTRHAAPA